MNAIARPSLLFNWGPSRVRLRALLIFVAVSLLFHIVCLYLFQIVYPPTAPLSPPQGRVTFITDTSEEGRALLRWIEAEDPALASATQRPPESRGRLLPRVEHIPSYVNRKPPLKDTPAANVDLRAPSAFPPTAVPTPNIFADAKPKVVSTSVHFSEDFDAFGQAKFPDTKFTASSAEQPENVRFRVAINSHGEVRYSFRLNSSGDGSLDDQARRHIALIRFPSNSKPNDETLTWGVATVTWGNDIARPARSTTTTP